MKLLEGESPMRFDGVRTVYESALATAEDRVLIRDQRAGSSHDGFTIFSKDAMDIPASDRLKTGWQLHISQETPNSDLKIHISCGFNSHGYLGRLQLGEAKKIVEAFLKSPAGVVFVNENITHIHWAEVRADYKRIILETSA